MSGVAPASVAPAGAAERLDCERRSERDGLTPSGSVITLMKR